MIDKLQRKLTVKWRWVEGHQDSEGNIQADESAKEGISAEKGFWQEKAYQWYMGSSFMRNLVVLFLHRSLVMQL